MIKQSSDVSCGSKAKEWTGVFLAFTLATGSNFGHCLWAGAANGKAAIEKPAAEKAKPPEKAPPRPEPVIENVVNATPEQLVDKPHEFLNKNVRLVANFFAFTSLALDYKPAFKSSKTNLSFLILRQNSKVPLSELKIAMPIPKEKDPDNQLLAQLKDGDQLEITGKVFAVALDEPWVEVLKLKKLASAPEEKKAQADEDDKSKDKKASTEDVKEKIEKQTLDNTKGGAKVIDKQQASPEKEEEK